MKKEFFKKYLLLMPRCVQKFGDGYAFPLGIPYISASMKKYGYQVFTMNLNHTDDYVEKTIISLIEKYKIDVVATGGQSFQYNSIRNILSIVKKYNTNIVTIVGGGIITAAPEVSMKALEFADYGVIGEGEITINELCKAIEKQLDISKVAGIIYRQGDMFQITDKRDEIKDLDTIPCPDYEGFGLDTYVDKIIPTMIASNKRNSLFMLTSRSCPFQCTFCFHTTGQTYRQRSLDDVFKELDFLMEKYNPKFVFFVDELFGSNMVRLKEFCTRIKKYKINWWSEFRVSDVNLEKLQLLKEAGCTNMSFGLESADNKVLKSMRKSITIEQIEKTLELVYNEGITIDGCFIFGDIEETFESSMRTLEWWEKHVEYDIGLGPITIYPGTFLYKYAVSKGIIEDEVEFLKRGCPQVNVSKMTSIEFAKLMELITNKNMSIRKGLDFATVVNSEYAKGQVSIKGKCSICGELNFWENVIVFRPAPLICKKCGQRYDMPITKDMKKNIEDNIRKILDKYERCAIWGINDKVMALILQSKVLQKKNIYLVDISEIKRNISVADKQIYSPQIINNEFINFVIVGVPFLYSNIELQIRNEYPQVDYIVDICKLFSEEIDIGC